MSGKETPDAKFSHDARFQYTQNEVSGLHLKKYRQRQRQRHFYSGLYCGTLHVWMINAVAISEQISSVGMIATRLVWLCVFGTRDFQLFRVYLFSTVLLYQTLRTRRPVPFTVLRIGVSRSQLADYLWRLYAGVMMVIHNKFGNIPKETQCPAMCSYRDRPLRKTHETNGLHFGRHSTVRHSYLTMCLHICIVDIKRVW